MSDCSATGCDSVHLLDYLEHQSCCVQTVRNSGREDAVLFACVAYIVHLQPGRTRCPETKLTACFWACSLHV